MKTDGNSKRRRYVVLPGARLSKFRSLRTSLFHTPFQTVQAGGGIQLLAVTNDNNDVIFLRVQESQSKTSPFSFELLTLASLHDLVGNYSMIHPSSLFSKALKPRIKVSSISCGPWLPTRETQADTYFATSNLAVAYGTTLKIIKLDIRLRYQRQDSGSRIRYELTAGSEENSNTYKYLEGQNNFTGPSQWIYTVGIGVTDGLFCCSRDF